MAGINHEPATAGTAHFFSNFPKPEFLQRLHPLRMQPLPGKSLLGLAFRIRFQKGYGQPGQTVGSGHSAAGRTSPHHDDVEAVFHRKLCDLGG